MHNLSAAASWSGILTLYAGCLKASDRDWWFVGKDIGRTSCREVERRRKHLLASCCYSLPWGLAQTVPLRNPPWEAGSEADLSTLVSKEIAVRERLIWSHNASLCGFPQVSRSPSRCLSMKLHGKQLLTLSTCLPRLPSVYEHYKWLLWQGNDPAAPARMKKAELRAQCSLSDPSLSRLVQRPWCPALPRWLKVTPQSVMSESSRLLRDEEDLMFVCPKYPDGETLFPVA